MADGPAVAIVDLHKTYRSGLLRRAVHALHGVSFEIARGEIFGLVGPNGAGKTTTLKILMDLVRPTRGHARLLGRPAGDVAAKRQIGFLPESPYFYEYLTARELLVFVGRLFGLPGRERAQRAAELLERVGLVEAADRPLRRYSKGMLQRVGLAQALVGRPALLVLDEPMSGLDPIGRKETRDLIADLRGSGTTVLLSTHILPDVELLCDRVAILAGGRARGVGRLDDLVSPRVVSTEVVLADAGAALIEALARAGEVTRSGSVVQVRVFGGADGVVRDALAAGARVVSVAPRRETLEEVFVREVAAARPQGPP